MSGQIEYRSWITRDMLQADPEARFVFGDNSKRVGLGGQAASMRGEPNAIGVQTKRAPGMADGDFFSPFSVVGTSDFNGIMLDLGGVVRALEEGRTVYVPRDGLGTGLSQLPIRAPAIANLITAFFRACPGEPCPWEFLL
jgi:hypothetical protein